MIAVGEEGCLGAHLLQPADQLLAHLADENMIIPCRRIARQIDRLPRIVGKKEKNDAARRKIQTQAQVRRRLAGVAVIEHRIEGRDLDREPRAGGAVGAL